MKNLLYRFIICFAACIPTLIFGQATAGGEGTATAGGTLIIKYNETHEVKGTEKYDEIIVESSKTGETGQIIFNGTDATLSTKKFTIHKFLDDQHWYFFSVPFDIEVSKIRFINTTINGIEERKEFVYGTDYLIKYYDQSIGANEEGKVSGWINNEKDNINNKALLYNNFGHMIGISPENCKTTMVLEYNKEVTLKHPNTYKYTIKEDNGNEYKDTGIQIWYNNRTEENDALFDINKIKDNKEWNWCSWASQDNLKYTGWNFISIPFLSNLTGTGSITYPDNSNPKVSIPNYKNFKTYKQISLEEAKDQDLLRPCSPFFIQLGFAAPPIYKFGNDAEKSRKNAAQIDNSSTAEIYVTAPDSKNDRTTIISEGGMTTEYEIGYDLLKLIGYADLPQLYSIQDNTILAYNTLEINSTRTIPLGIFVPQDGEYTVSLGDKSNFDVIILNDALNGTRNDLKSENYKADIKRGEYKDRFSITLRNNYLPTESKTSEIDLNPIVYKNNDNLCIERVPENSYIRIYDSLGRSVASSMNISSNYNFKPLCHGVYIIIIESENETFKMKTIY